MVHLMSPDPEKEVSDYYSKFDLVIEKKNLDPMIGSRINFTYGERTSGPGIFPLQNCDICRISIISIARERGNSSQKRCTLRKTFLILEEPEMEQ